MIKKILIKIAVFIAMCIFMISMRLITRNTELEQWYGQNFALLNAPLLLGYILWALGIIKLPATDKNTEE